jgi:OOP family OmpA-OmpF porin
MKLKHTLLATGFAALSITGSFAQDAQKAVSATTNGTATKSKFLDHWSIGVNAGTLLFYGDVKQYDYYPVTKFHNEYQFGYGLTITKTLTPVFGIQGALLNGQVSATKRAKLVNGVFVGQGLYFVSDVFEYTLSGVINFSNISFSGQLEPRKFNFYGLVGVGISSYKTSLYDLYTDKLVGQEPYGGSYNGRSRSRELVMPVGLGAKYRINKKFDIGLESTFHFINTDKFDGVVAGNAKDVYQYTDVTFTYKIGEKTNSMDWINPIQVLAMKQDSLATKVNGLTNDADKDGVSDLFDKDSNTPEGAKVYGDGTAVDTDGDGVADAQDSDPFSAKGAKVDSKGKEFDADNDGVPDSRDLEPNSASGALVNFQGKTIMVDAKTNTTDEASTAYLPSIYFNTNSANVQYKYYENLAAVARVMKTNPSIKLTVVGNTDKVGNEESNKKLGMKSVRYRFSKTKR